MRCTIYKRDDHSILVASFDRTHLPKPIRSMVCLRAASLHWPLLPGHVRAQAPRHSAPRGEFQSVSSNPLRQIYHKPQTCYALLSMFVTHLECSACGLHHPWSCLQNLCLSCRKPLFAIVDLAAASRTLKRETMATREKSLWLYREVLPLPVDVEPVSLGEGGTPLPRAQKFSSDIDLWIKDESLNPTQSFKARGMSVAVSMAKHLGATKLAVPSAGNAGGALAAYAARAGLEAHIFMPRDTPRANIIECCELGAHLTLIDGLITDCGAEIAKRKRAEGWFDMSTLKEPYRVEGKKTLGYELAEQSDWELHNVLLYPTGGGTGLIGMWTAFAERETLSCNGRKARRI